MSFSVELDKKQMDSLYQGLGVMKKNADVVLMRAINQGVKGGKTDASKIIRSQVTIKKKDVDKNIKTKLASKSSLNGKISFKSEKMPLVKFTHSETFKGVSVKVWKSGSKEVFPHTFKATVGKGGHTGIFIRKSKYLGKGKHLRPPKNKRYAYLPKTHRFPIVELRGPTLEFLYKRAREAVGPIIEVNAQQRFFDEFDRQFNLLLKDARF